MGTKCTAWLWWEWGIKIYNEINDGISSEHMRWGCH